MEKNFFQRMLFKLIGLSFVLAAFACNQSTEGEQQKPNVVMVFLDDAGFADFKPFGETRYPTPNVSELAEEGRSYYNFYVPVAVSSASRAALLSGCYPGRTGVFGAHGPNSECLDPEFATLGEVMQQNGYTTASFGKWHLGDVPGQRPHSRGFDESCGLMYSNDMWPYHPENPEHWGQWPLPYWENGEVKIDSMTPKDQRNLSTWYTENAVDFINRHDDEPFFLYVPHSMPHVPLFVSDKFKGESGLGLYEDVMMELDWSVGEIMDALEKNGVEENTMFIFIGSDNGPWLSYMDRAGKTPYREGKGTTFDGGVRNSCIIRYPEHIEPNTVSHNAFASIDILPTICHVTGSPLPDNEIDGKNVWDLITHQPGAENPHDYYPFARHSSLEAVISADGHWKLHLPHQYRSLEKGEGGTYTRRGVRGLQPDSNLGEQIRRPLTYTQRKIDTALFDMVHDPYEKRNVFHRYPEITDRLMEYAEQHNERFYE
ncbi:MAG: sulfatase-like hydrolase/transferase [Bacteroidales bacterium]